MNEHKLYQEEKVPKKLAARILREYDEIIYIGGPRKGVFYQPINTIEIEQKIQHWLGK